VPQPSDEFGALDDPQAVLAHSKKGGIVTSARIRTADPSRHHRRLVMAARRLRWRFAKAASKLLGRKRTTYVDERVDEYRAYWEDATRTLGGYFAPLCPGVWEIRHGVRRTRIASDLVQIDDPVTLRLAGNKTYCCDVASRLGIPTAPHRLFRLGEVDAAWRFMVVSGGIFVVKPATRSSSALGVTMHVRTRRHLENAAALASLYSDELMVEAMVPAESCRLLYLDGELIDAVRRRGVRVVGDGRSSIKDLLTRSGFRRLNSDKATLSTLEAQKLSPASRLPAGREVVARYLPAGQQVTPELRTTYNECITALVCPQLARSLAAVVAQVGSRFAGVDVLTNDPSVPLNESSGVFLELNTTPSIHHHYVGRKVRPVAVRVLHYLLEKNSDEQRRNRLLA
jgi:D-alanine-D-alanine ligase-like ATP-grasp enzyme